MWNPEIQSCDSITLNSFNKLSKGEIPAIIIRDFYSNSECQDILQQMKNEKIIDNHLVGPFLMSHTTDKTNYFLKSEKILPVFDRIFFHVENPHSKVAGLFSAIFPKHSVSIASEDGKQYSPYIFRIHKKGKSIPLHKDNVKYEGIEYAVSKISKQFSCVVHLQESEIGGNLIISNKQWEKGDEKFREIDFGYSQKLVENYYNCILDDLHKGDLVIINPNFFHQVTEIQGKSDRITVGMFVGIDDNLNRIVCWA